MHIVEHAHDAVLKQNPLRKNRRLCTVFLQVYFPTLLKNIVFRLLTLHRKFPTRNIAPYSPYVRQAQGLFAYTLYIRYHYLCVPKHKCTYCTHCASNCLRISRRGFGTDGCIDVWTMWTWTVGGYLINILFYFYVKLTIGEKYITLFKFSAVLLALCWDLYVGQLGSEIAKTIPLDQGRNLRSDSRAGYGRRARLG